MLVQQSKKKKIVCSPERVWTVNHGNWTSFYSRDTDVNDIETVLDNFSTTDTHEYKRFYHFTKECGETSEVNFWPDKMLSLSGFRLLYPIFFRGEMRKILREVGILTAIGQYFCAGSYIKDRFWGYAS